MKVRGFILQASYRVVTEPDGRRVPVVHLYGRLEDGGTFLVRDDRQRPHFYIRADQAAAARAVGAPEPEPSDKRTFGGLPVCRVAVETPPDVPGLRDRLQAAGIDTFEADVRFAVRYLIERGIKGGCEIEGDGVPGTGIAWVFDNPTLRPAAVDVEPRVLSFDIETDGKGERLLAISLYGPGVDEVLIVDGGDRPMPERATRCKDELAAFDAFTDRIRRLDPDVLTGWNTVDFDLTALQRIATRLRHPFNLGREPGPLRIRKAEGYFGSGQATIPGRLVLDGIDLLRGAFVRMDDYSLDAVAREVLGEGKAVAGEVRDRIHEIMHNYEHDLPAFALYARTDARLAYEIVRKLDLVRLAFARSRLTGMTPDRVAASIASFDFLYLTELERRRLVTPTVRSDDASVHAAQQGGHVLEPVTGLHRHVWVFDFKSLYPSIIRTFNIDPVAYVAEPSPGADLIETPGGRFRREPAILPSMLDELFPRREAAKKAGDDVAANAIKILMNSFYGVLGTPACRFHNPALANSITGLGRHLLQWSKQWFEAAGFRVLYGDTDSLFVLSGIDDPETARARGPELAASLNDELARYIGERWRVPSRLELKFEKLYLKLFLPRVRHGTGGARKRYAGLLHGGGADSVEFVGMEVVRRDWTALAKEVQRELYQRLFSDRSVNEYLADVVKRVRRGDLDEALVYRKNLRKDTGEYTATTPPHVVAARKMTQPPGRLISYVMTTAGPEPLDNVQHPLDREHYVVKQVKPVAEPVLATLGLDFERVIGDSRQLDMYALLGAE
ncbi:DNA polymerase II [Sulfurifustis variabilis]|uniref:DNA polymerase n=1 Tax=Sulfurifustis variabilis TaxID=1675686 RepID=A0A1B4V737_9GAMM|nr:DNA polymerase II [Sulfurifustis variabilis]BAU49353.1 DNA polymerase II [Sulfurifustis variabilis]